MKILHVADLHLQHKWFDWVASRCTEFDLLVIAGDLQNAFAQPSMHEQARTISKWLVSLSTPLISCTGNHDWAARDCRVSVDTSAEGRWIKNLRGKGNIIGVDGDIMEFGGLTFVVNGWLRVPDVQQDIDVIVTHAPPAGCDCASGAEGRDVGDPDLWPALCDHPPRLILSGHVHEPKTQACIWPPIDPASLVLVPGYNEGSPIPAHWIIDTCAKTATHSGGDIVRFA